MAGSLDERTVERLTETLASLPAVRLAYLFGSHAAGRARPESDVDVAVLLRDEDAADTAWALARLFDHLGRIVPSHRLDVVLLNRAPSLLRHRILTGGRLLLARDETTRLRFVTRTIQDYQDMQVRRQGFYRARVEGTREGTPHGRSGDLLAEARRAAKLLGLAPELPRRH